MNDNGKSLSNSLPVIFLGVRLMTMIAIPIDGLRGYGDLAHFFNLAGMGWPYLEYWVEFPPIFPFLSTLIYIIAAGREQTYDYLLILLFTLAQVGSLIVFIKIAQLVYSEREAEWRSWVYLVILIGLHYGWWYFDPFVVLLTLLTIYMILLNRSIPAGLALAAGILTKLFPALLLPAIWRYQAKRSALIVTFISIGITLVLHCIVYLLAPENTTASLRSQGNKSSWETIWALVDGNFNTGNIGTLVERLDPETSVTLSGNPPRYSPYITIIPFVALGVWLFKRAQVRSAGSFIDFIGLTWCLFLLWMPGWSPQWVMYIIPLILVSLPIKESMLMTFALILINLLEWPVLLSRGYQSGLWLTITVRTLLLLLLGYIWYRQLFHNTSGEHVAPNMGEIVVD